MPRERLRLTAAVGVQLVILALVPLRPVLAAWRGQEVTLATAPVDPFDPFHGAYVRLAYEVERTPPDRAGPDPEEGSVVFLVVEQAEPAGYGHALSLARDFVAGRPFLHLVSDHVYLSDAPETCAR